MSEDKIKKEQRAATQTVAKALDDAIGDDDPVEHETTVFARDQDVVYSLSFHLFHRTMYGL